MGYELPLIVGYTLLSLIVTAAWVGGYLDPYQKKLQNLALDKMGDNRASYGVKSAISAPKTGDKNVDKLQDNLGKDVGGQVGKGGVGESVGSTLSKGL